MNSGVDNINHQDYNGGMNSVEHKRKPKKLPLSGLPNQIRRKRLAREMSLPAVAEYLDVTPQAVRKAETTGKGLNKEKWYKLADLFECDPRELEKPEKVFAENLLSS